jgi:UDP-N-acetylglucosamine--N-acetylmuramyl-(pentapeptide) pyrophosphoryl-undecaprenol N-acetylglucosamine transferase
MYLYWYASETKYSRSYRKLGDLMSTVVFAAGGTGGHIIPALTTATLLKAKRPEIEILFIGSGNDLEKKLLENSPFKYYSVNAVAIVGNNINGLIKFVLTFIPSIIELSKIYEKEEVKVVIGFGGYTSVLPIIASFFSSIPRIIFEQNGKVGLANKFLAIIANKIYAVPGVKRIFFRKPKVILNPVREEIKASIVPPKEKLPLKIFIFGGSQGAVTMNTAITQILDILSVENCEVVHQTGQKDFERIKKIYKDKPNLHAISYIENMHTIIQESDLLICRAGASTVSEVTSSKKPAIFIPLAISRSHQKYNVSHLLKGGAAFMLEQDVNLESNLRQILLSIFLNTNKLTKMHLAYDGIKELNELTDGAEELTTCIQSYL